MKNKDFENDLELYNLVYGNDNNLFERKVLKTAKNTEKNNKKSKKTDERLIIEDKFAKNVISARKNIRKKTMHIEKQNSKRRRRANDQLLQSDLSSKDIYLTIDKFNNNGKKTVVYFIDSFFPVIDGVVAVLDNYAVQMQKYYNVVICAPKHKGSIFKTDKYFVLYADSLYIKAQGYDLGFPQLDPVFQKYISLLKIDLIHIQAPFNMGNYGLSLGKRRKVPILTSFHSQFKQNFYSAVKNEVIAQWLTKILMTVYQRSTLVVTMNDFAKKLLREYGLRKQVEIVPNATNLKPKEFDSEYEKEILKKYHINKDVFNMIFIGRFVSVKNVYFILDILIDLYKINPNFNFIFLGYGPEQNKMQKIVKENGLENVIKFTGKVDSLDEKSILIKNSNILLFPSVYDTDGIVKIECACFSVPALCIEETGAASNIKDNHNGFIEEDSKEAFVKRLDYLLKNVDFVKKIGENAKSELYITWEDVCEMLHNLYQKTLKTYHFKNSQKNKNKTTEKSDAKF